MSSLINYDNASTIETQNEYPEFFAIIRSHKAFRLYHQFIASLNEPYNPRDVLKEYEKEKKKLMKLLQPFKHLCKQPGVAIDRVMREEVRNVPRVYRV